MGEREYLNPHKLLRLATLPLDIAGAARSAGDTDNGSLPRLQDPARRAWLPTPLGLSVAVLLVDLPVLLGVMLVAGKKRNGRYSLYGGVLYREEVSWKTFALVFVGAFVVVYVLMIAVTPLTTWMPR